MLLYVFGGLSSFVLFVEFNIADKNQNVKKKFEKMKRKNIKIDIKYFGNKKTDNLKRELKYLQDYRREAKGETTIEK